MLSNSIENLFQPQLDYSKLTENQVMELIASKVTNSKLTNNKQLKEYLDMETKYLLE